MSESVSLTPRLDRSLRLEELLVSAIAMPLPSAPISAPIEGHDIQANADALLDSDSPIVSLDIARDPQPNADAAVRLDTTQHDAPSDAVDGSLQASLQAIRVSLDDSHAAASATAAINSDSPDEQPQHSLPHAAGTQIMPIGDGATASLMHDAVAAVSTDAASAHQPAATSFAVSEGPVAAVSPFGTLLQGPDMGHFGALTGLASNLNGASGVLGVAVSGAFATADHLVGSLVQDAFHGVGETVSGAAGGLLGSVTVPSLGGSGLDALAGLLPQALASAIGHLDPDLSSLIDHTLVALPIGIDNEHHTDPSLAHLAHPSLPLIGTGLI